MQLNQLLLGIYFALIHFRLVLNLCIYIVKFVLLSYIMNALEMALYKINIIVFITVMV